MDIRLEYNNEDSNKKIEYYDIYIDNKLLKEWHNNKSYISIFRKERKVHIYIDEEIIYYKLVVEYIKKIKKELNIKGYKVY
jgi:hypothetical protein